MPGPNARFTAQGDRQAKHVAAGYEAKGMDPAQAESIGYAVATKSGKRKSKKISARPKKGYAT